MKTLSAVAITRPAAANSINWYALKIERRLPVAVAPARTRVIFKLSPMPLKPAKSLAIKLGDSGIEKPKLEY